MMRGRGMDSQSHTRSAMKRVPLGNQRVSNPDRTAGRFTVLLVRLQPPPIVKLIPRSSPLETNEEEGNVR